MKRAAGPGWGGDGFALVEVIVALFLLGVVTPALLALGQASRRALTAAAGQAELLTVVEEVADSLRADGGGVGVRETAWGRVRWGGTGSPAAETDPEVGRTAEIEVYFGTPGQGSGELLFRARVPLTGGNR